MTKVSFENNTLLIGRYHIIRYLAAGGMQEVYLCHDTVLNREVVLKTPKAGTKDRRFDLPPRLDTTLS